MKIRKDILEHIVAHAQKDAPIEACGYLLGEEGSITTALPMTNADGREDHFTFDPKEQFDAYKKARSWGVRIIGAYHSHPATPARPSAEDIRLALHPELLYVIVSLAGNERTIKAFWIREGKAREEPLVIEDREE